MIDEVIETVTNLSHAVLELHYHIFLWNKGKALNLMMALQCVSTESFQPFCDFIVIHLLKFASNYGTIQ